MVQTFESLMDAAVDANIPYPNFNRYVKNKIVRNGYFYEHAEPPVEGTKEVTCDNCKRVFLRQTCRMKNQINLFCSKKCESEYKISHRVNNCECEVCHKKMHRKPYHLKKYKHTYCSYDCMYIAFEELMKGENNHQYGLKGDLNASWRSDSRISSYGYMLIRKLDHPFKNCDDFVFEHRLVAEQYLLNDENSIIIDGKRYLKQEYDVHHKDQNRLNNDVSNLQVLTRSEHKKVHWMLKNKEAVEQVAKEVDMNYIDVSTTGNEELKIEGV